MEPLPGPDPEGFSWLYVDSTWHQDTLPYRASTKLLKQMGHLQSRHKEMGDGHGMTAKLPTWEAKEEIKSIAPGGHQHTPQGYYTSHFSTMDDKAG